MDKLKYYLVPIVLLIGIAGTYLFVHNRQRPVAERFSIINDSEVDRLEEGAVTGSPSAKIMPASSKTDQANDRTSTAEVFMIEMPSISLSAPVILNVDGNNKEEYMKALESGVAHLKKTALPGNSGNAVIFGHSSYFKNLPGDYKDIFAKNNDLQIGDKINLKSNQRTLTYQVSSKDIVQPEDIAVTSQDFKKHELTLITCWPVFTTERRLVIKANEI